MRTRIKQPVYRWTDNTKASKQFKDLSLEERTLEATKIRAKYPDRIPVIVTKSEKSNISDINKCKFLVPSDLSVGQFIYIIRKRVKLNSEDAIFLFFNNSLQPSHALMGDIYKQYADESGFLMAKYSGESVFGSM